MANRRWSRGGEQVENPAIDAFLAEIVEVSRRHGLSISHEDSHGGFEIEKYDDHNIAWLNEAADATGGK